MQFVNDHGGCVRFSQENLGKTCVAIDSGQIDGANATARERRNVEASVLTAGRKQLNGVADFHVQQSGQTGSNDNGVRLVSEIIQTAIDNLMSEIGRLKMECRLNAVKIDGRILKARARAQRPAKNRRTRDDI